tara:strand:+ start:68 stop:409 length:342 start_codon:yes stop_codon:yes gene_type:complete
MAMNRNYATYSNENLMAEYIIQSTEKSHLGLATRSSLTKGLRNALSNTYVEGKNSINTDILSEGIYSYIKKNRLRGYAKKTMIANLEDAINFWNEDSIGGGTLLDILAPSQSE